MSTIAGASRYLVSAQLSAKLGTTFSAGDILSQSGIGSDLLDAASNLRVKGAGGLSAYSRYLNRQALKSNASTINTLFSYTGGASASIEAAQTQIKALQSTTRISRLTPDLRQQIEDQAKVAADETKGTNVDTTA